jgi:hypothetical protein
MHRQCGPKAKGLNPPDDVRHRELKWDLEARMWVPRDFERLNGRFSSRDEVNDAYFGEDGTTARLGRASLLRQTPETEYRKEKRRKKSSRIGPYLPLILEACRERELSYEYRHGVTSYGAFTFALCEELRARRRVTFKRLVEVTRAKLADLQYDQEPQILGPTKIMNASVPWRVRT